MEVRLNRREYLTTQISSTFYGFAHLCYCINFESPIESIDDSSLVTLFGLTNVLAMPSTAPSSHHLCCLNNNFLIYRTFFSRIMSDLSRARTFYHFATILSVHNGSHISNKTKSLDDSRTETSRSHTVTHQKCSCEVRT